MRTKENIHLLKIAELLAEIGVLLISNGANSSRTARNLQRIAEAFGFQVEHFFSHSAIVLTVADPFSSRKETIVKSIRSYHVNFSIVSELSILSWEIADHKVAFDDIARELEDIRQMDSYPEWLKFVLIGVATGALAMIFGGSGVEFLIAFFAGVSGIAVRKMILSKHYNVYMSWLIASLISASAVNIFRKFGLEHYQGALTACVLWLIPGVPLINGFLDILEGHIVSGWAKSAMGFMLVFMIAVGFYLSLFLFGYGATV